MISLLTSQWPGHQTIVKHATHLLYASWGEVGKVLRLIVGLKGGGGDGELSSQRELLVVVVLPYFLTVQPRMLQAIPWPPMAPRGQRSQGCCGCGCCAVGWLCCRSAAGRCCCGVVVVVLLVVVLLVVAVVV